MTITGLPGTSADDATPGTHRGSDYAELSRLLRDAGLMRRRPGHFAVRVVATAALFAARWGAFVVLGPTWWQLAIAVFLGIMFTQLGFLGHDVGHKQMVRRRG